VYGRGSDTLPSHVWRHREELWEIPVNTVGVRDEIRTGNLETTR